MNNCLQVGIDFSQKGADFCLLFPDGQVLDMHQHFTNSQSGYEQAKTYVLEAIQRLDGRGDWQRHPDPSSTRAATCRTVC